MGSCKGSEAEIRGFCLISPDPSRLAQCCLDYTGELSRAQIHYIAQSIKGYVIALAQSSLSTD